MRQDDLRDPDARIVVDVLRRQAEHIGDDLFLLDETGAEFSFGAVDDLVNRHANAYRSLGIAKGDSVAMLMENSAMLAATTFGVNRAGGIWSPVSPEYRGHWLTELLRDVRSKVLVDDAHLVAAAVASEVPFDHVVVNGAYDGPTLSGATMHSLDDFAESPATALDVPQHFGDTTAVLWTSGTTGRSKGVMQPNNAWITYSLVHNTAFRAEVRDGERFYGCVPMYNSGGWIANIYPALVAGVPACIDRRFSVSSFWDRVRHYSANHTMTLGAMTAYLCQLPERDNDYDNPLRTVIMNPPIPALVEIFLRRFGVEYVAAGFGQSEIMGATLYRSDMSLKPGSSGFTSEEDVVETRLLDDNDMDVGRGETGEICVRPRKPYVIFNGYWHQPDETIIAFRNLWHHSGDLGRFDADGELFFVDRKKDSTRHKGRNIASFEVEHIVRQFAGVAQCAVVGVKVPELQYEEELMVYVLPAEGADIDPLELCRFIDANAPYFFVPRYVEVVTDLPVTPTNKVQKFKLRERGLTANSWDREQQTDWQPTRSK